MRLPSVLLRMALLGLLLAPDLAGAASPWPKPLGGPGKESATGVAADDEGHSFVVGTFDGPSSFGEVHLASAGGSDVFVTALDADAKVLWAVAIGGPGADEGRGIAFAASSGSGGLGGGDVYVTGSFSGTADFDPGPGRTELTSAGGTDAFLLRLKAKGELVWARRLGGPQDDAGVRVAVSAEAVWVVGTFKGTMEGLPSAGGRDAFLAKFDLDGHLLWTKRIGGPKDDEGRAVAAGRNGEVWVCGDFETSPSIGPEGGGLDMTSAGRSDVFILRLDSTGRMLWSGQIGGEGEDSCEGMAATNAGGVAVIGEFWHTADVDPGPGVLSYASHGKTDAFLVSLDGIGRMQWSQQFGETGFDLGLGIAADRFGSVYTTGYLDRRGESLSWVDEHSESGQRTWSLGLEATGGLHALAIAASPQGITTVVGWFKGETKELREAGAGRVKGFAKTDAFVWRLLPAGPGSRPQRPRLDVHVEPPPTGSP